VLFPREQTDAVLFQTDYEEFFCEEETSVKVGSQASGVYAG
jgi:hypothetical protein